MTESLYQLQKRIITGTVLAGIFIAVYFYGPPLIFSLVFGVVLCIILLTEWPRLCRPHPLLWLLTPLYPILPFMLFIMLNHDPLYRPLIVSLILIVAAHDMGSYIAGNLWGRRKILPRVSPQKTWEGFWGGYVLAYGAMLVFLYMIGKTIYPLALGALVLVISAVSLSGDMFESWLKRRAGLKDSGSILPGHGGFLDRFDGLMFVVTIVYLCARWF